MKRILCLVLCLLMLLCIGCKKEEPEPQLNAGTFYTSAGNTYNTHIRITFPEQNLTAPVTTLTLEVHNDTDFTILLATELDSFSGGTPWRKWADGEWHLHPYNGGVFLEYAYLGREIAPHSTCTFTQDFDDEPCEVGIYRLRAEFKVPTVPQAPPRTGTRCVAEAYLAILPAPEA